MSWTSFPLGLIIPAAGKADAVSVLLKSTVPISVIAGIVTAPTGLACVTASGATSEVCVTTAGLDCGSKKSPLSRAFVPAQPFDRDHHVA